MARLGPKTEWVFPLPWHPGPPEREVLTVSRDSQQALFALLNEDIRRGNRNLAIRHFLMLQACGVRLPEALRLSCEDWLHRCPPRTHAQISAAVNRWAQLVDLRAQSPLSAA